MCWTMRLIATGGGGEDQAVTRDNEVDSHWGGGSGSNKGQLG